MFEWRCEERIGNKYPSLKTVKITLHTLFTIQQQPQQLYLCNNNNHINCIYATTTTTTTSIVFMQQQQQQLYLCIPEATNQSRMFSLIAVPRLAPTILN